MVQSSPEWLGPATDCLKEYFSEEAGEYLAAEPAVRDRLERAVVMLERIGRDVIRNGQERFLGDNLLPIIAEHRGEKPEETLARLRPQIPPGTSLSATMLANARVDPEVPEGIVRVRNPDGTDYSFRIP